MREGRPAIPSELERQVLMEAGHRCAIPTCKHTTTEIAHIDAWSKVKEHRFENMIALCPNCHALYDDGKIDRKSMLQYKANLSILNGRYGDLERRVLKFFADYPNHTAIWLPGGLGILVAYLVQDGLLALHEKEQVLTTMSQFSKLQLYELTDAGKKLVDRWMAAQALD